MPYNYDYFISYSHADNQSKDGKSGFIDEFVKKLRDSKEHQEMFGGKINVFFDKTEIHNMSDWDNIIRSNLASSRFLIVLLSPGYFKSEYCAREFDWWMEHEMHRRVLGEGTAPILIVDVANIYDYKSECVDTIPQDLQIRFPNWLNQIRRIQSGVQFDMHDLDRAKINDVLNSLRDEVKEKVRRQDSAENSPQNALYPQYNENFVGRRENLRSLRKSLIEKTAATYSALIGLGGFGKTELALTYGHAFAWDYQLGRVFVKCDNKTSIFETLLTSGIAEMHGWELPKGSEEQQITFLFNRLNVKRDEIVKRNMNEERLNTLGAHILLILDNVSRRELISKNNLAILPDYFHVIITTRENTNDISHLHTESVERLSEDESVELLSNLRPFANSDEAKAARNIAQLLAGFTLIVELTGAYLHNNKHITCQKQYERLITNHSETFQKMAVKTGDLTRHAAETVSAVLESTLSVLSPNARKALDYASVMAPDAVALGWIPELLDLDEDDGWDVLNELTGYSLLTPLEREVNIARMHSLVASTVKQRIPLEFRKEITDKIREKCNALLEKDETFWCTSDNSWNIKPVSEFCLAIAENWTLETTEEEINWGITKMLKKTGRTQVTLGKIDDALFIFKQFLRISKERASIFSSDAVRSNLGYAYSDLAQTYYKIGNLETARELHTQAFTIRKSIAEKQPNNNEIQCDLADSYGYLGIIEEDKGNLEDAKKYYSEMLITSEKFQSTQDNRVLQNLNTSFMLLGNLEYEEGNRTVAREWLEKAIEIHKQLANKMPEDVNIQRDMSISYSRLGDLENTEGNIAVSREWYEKAIEIHKQLANKMPENVKTLQGLSILYSKLGDMEKITGNTSVSREWYEKAIEIQKQHANKMPEDIKTQLDLGFLYSRLGDLEQESLNISAARKWFEKNIDIYLSLSKKIPESVEIQRMLSVSYDRLGNLEDIAQNTDTAKMWHEKAMKTCLKLVDIMPENVQIQRGLIVSYIHLGKLDKAGGNTDSARKWYQKALEIHKSLAEKMPADIEVQRDLCALYMRLGNLEKEAGNTDSSRKWYEKVLEILNRLSNKMPDNVELQQDLFFLYFRLGDLEETAGNTTIAQAWYKKTLENTQQLSDKMPENIQAQMYFLLSNFKIGVFELNSFMKSGKLEPDADNVEPVLKLYKNFSEMARQIFDVIPDDLWKPLKLKTMYDLLADFEKSLGNSDSARKWYQFALKIQQRLTNKMPVDVDSLRDLSISYTNLADLENAAGNADAARTWYEKALEIFQQLSEKMPEDVNIQKDLSETLEKLALVQKAD